MRFLQIFLRVLAFALLGGLVIAAAGREILLFTAAHNVSRQAQQLSQINRWQKYFSHCQQRFVTETTTPVLGMQLRFVDDKEYVIEIICDGNQTVEIESFSLPMWVHKTTGSAGFHYDLEQRLLSGELTVTLYRQSRIVYVEGESVGQQWGVTELRSGVPVSQCGGHGLKCCPVEEFEGVGLPQIDGVSDCPGGCFSSCLRRPILLSFQSDPFIDLSTRQAVAKGPLAFVRFSYIFDAAEADLDSVTINYGDGSIGALTTSRGEFEKEYSCNNPAGCQFTVTLEALDARGVVSATTRLSTIIINVTP